MQHGSILAKHPIHHDHRRPTCLLVTVQVAVKSDMLNRGVSGYSGAQISVQREGGNMQHQM